MATEITLIKSAIAQIRGDGAGVGCREPFRGNIITITHLTLIFQRVSTSLESTSILSLSEDSLVCLDLQHVISHCFFSFYRLTKVNDVCRLFLQHF